MKKLLSLLLLSLMLSSCQQTVVDSTSTDSSIVDSTNSTSTQIPSSSLDLEELTQIVEALIEVPTQVSANITLLKKVDDYPSITIDWVSSNPEILSSEGVYTSPASDEYVTLTYTINHYYTVLANKSIEVLVLSYNSSLYDIVLDWLYSFNFDIPSTITFPLALRQSVLGYADVPINWSTNSEFLKYKDGMLYPRSGTFAQNINLTAKIEVNGETLMRVFKVVVPKLSDVLPELGDKYHGLPIIEITTDNGQLPPKSPSEDITPPYLSGTFKMSKSQAYLPSEAVPQVPMQIRARGNYTQVPDKKPYRVKFDKKQSLLGMGAAKNWVLLADYLDETYLREATVKTFAQSLDGMRFNTRAFHVEVYINGDYRGLYLLTDQVQEQETRIDIYEGEDAVDTGYIFEWDFKKNAKDVYNVNYFDMFSGVDQRTLQMVYPEALTSQQRIYLQGEINKVYNAIKSNYSTISGYKDIFNINSAIDYIIANEVFKNQDVWHLSSYMIKDKDQPLEYGPVWDFHLSSGSCNYAERAIPNEWHTPRANRNRWFFYLMSNDEFRALFKQRWNEIIENQVRDMMDFIYERKTLIDLSVYHTNQKWGVIRSELPPLARNLRTYDEFVKYLYDWLNASVAYINSEVNSANFLSSSYRSMFSSDYTAGIVSAKETALSNLPKYF